MEFTVAHPFVCLLAGELSPPLAHKLQRLGTMPGLHSTLYPVSGAGLKVRVQSIFVEKMNWGK